MPTPTKGARLGGSPAHERMMLANLATSLFKHGKISTTHAKAKRLRPLAERMVTFAKRGDLHARRQVLTVVREKDVVGHLFDEIAPRYVDRNGGYTRITKTGIRRGDAAPMAVIELVTEELASTNRPARTNRATRRAAKTESVAALAREDEPTASTSSDEPVTTDTTDDTAPAELDPENAPGTPGTSAEPGTSGDSAANEPAAGDDAAGGDETPEPAKKDADDGGQ